MISIVDISYSEETCRFLARCNYSMAAFQCYGNRKPPGRKVVSTYGSIARLDVTGNYLLYGKIIHRTFFRDIFKIGN